MVREGGVEPPHQRRQILSLVRLPIPPPSHPNHSIKRYLVPQICIRVKIKLSGKIKTLVQKEPAPAPLLAPIQNAGNTSSARETFRFPQSFHHAAEIFPIRYHPFLPQEKNYAKRNHTLKIPITTSWSRVN